MINGTVLNWCASKQIVDCQNYLKYLDFLNQFSTKENNMSNLFRAKTWLIINE